MVTREARISLAKIAVLAFAGVSLAAGSAAAAPLPMPSISATPGLTPAFNSANPDYTVTCGSGPVTMTAVSPKGVTVSIGDTPRTGGTNRRSLILSPGRRFGFTVAWAYGSRAFRTASYSVRCRPDDLPIPEVTRYGATPRAAWVMLAPQPFRIVPKDNFYGVIYNSWGAPVWWKAYPRPPEFTTLIGRDTIANFEWTGPPVFRGAAAGRWDLTSIDGSPRGKVELAGSALDFHELTPTKAGTFLTDAYELRSGADLTSGGGPDSTSVMDGVIRELSPSGTVLWQWDTHDPGHISPSETLRYMTPKVLMTTGGTVYDTTHVNAVAEDGDGILLSSRNTDAVYRIIKVTGAIDWKLGGLKTGKSLAVIGDDRSPTLAAQHDVRRLADGTISVFDNGSDVPGGRAPRVVRYRIDPKARTATVVSTISDPLYPSSVCCGSARQLSGGHWLIDWGGALGITETSSTGTPIVRYEFPSPADDQVFSYRAIPLTPRDLPRDALIKGMDSVASNG